MKKQLKSNYYTDQIDKALTDHDFKYPFSIQFKGSVNNGNCMTCPPELIRIIREWYLKNQ